MKRDIQMLYGKMEQKKAKFEIIKHEEIQLGMIPDDQRKDIENFGNADIV